MKFHDELNPKLWEKTQTEKYELKEEVADKLEEITDAFMDYLNINPEAIIDVRITGSSANYNYTPYSDLDLHLVIDYEKVHEDCPIVEGYLWAMKSEFNKEHDISIYRIPVEVYAEDMREEAISNGVYSLLNAEWIKEPKKIEPTTNDAAIQIKYNEIKQAIDKMNDSEEASDLLDKIYKMRKAGLANGGEFSTENLTFKLLRNDGSIDKLRNIKKERIDKELTLESFANLAKKLNDAINS
jgi:predicted nucleotidyltransferase